MRHSPTLSAAVIAAVLFISACAEEPAQTTRRGGGETPVMVEPVNITAERTRVDAVGTSRAIKSITIFPATSGEVTSVNFQPGQYVNEGDLLVVLDDRQEKLAVELAEVRLTDAERTFRRFEESAAQGATIPTTLDAARTELEAARIELNRARIAFDDRHVEAPFSGHVGITDIDPGDRIQTSTPITTLDDRSSLLVSFEVPEVMIDRVVPGASVSIATWAHNAERAIGEVIDIDSRIDPQTRTFTTRASVNNDGDQLRPGMSFRVSLDLAGNAYPVLSEISLQWGEDGAYVWSVRDGRAQRVPVNIVQRQKGQVLVRAKLAGGDLIVVEGIQNLRPGASVKPEMVIAAELPGAGERG